MAVNEGGYLDPNTGDYIGNSQYNFTVTIDTDVTGNVYGRRSVSGKDAEKASVTITNGIVSKNVYGGYVELEDADVSSNSVTISGDSTITGSVCGGLVNEGTGDATGNSVTISGGTVNNFVFGGASDYGKAASNNIIISDGTIKEDIIGGSSVSGEVASNTVSISGGTVNGEVYGGFALKGNVANNSVMISGGTFTSESKFYAGDILTPSNSTISDNLVNLTGNIIGLDRVDIYGYYFEEGSGTHSGNELHIGRAVDYDDEDNIQRDSEGNIKYKSDSSTTWYGKSSDGTANNSINKIANFETLALHSVALDNDLPAIKAASLENIGTVDITDLKFYENSSEKTTFNIGDKMNLLTWENEKEALINLKYKLNGTGDEQTVAFSDNPNGITVKTLSVSEKDKGISFERTGTGGINKVDKALEFSFASIP